MSRARDVIPAKSGGGWQWVAMQYATLGRELVDALEKAIRIAYLRDNRALYPSEEIALEECLKVHRQAKDALDNERD